MSNRSLALTAAQLKTLHDLAVDKGITPPYTVEQVDEILNDDSLSDIDRGRMFSQLHRGIHELLYAPPRQ